MKRKVFSVLFITILASFLAGCSLFGEPIEVPEEPVAGTLVFQSNRSGSWQIYKMTLPDGQAEQLTSEGRNWQPRLSPDGTKIVFDSIREGSRTVYTMNIDGSEQTRVGPLGGDARNATWSPDGEYIAFHSQLGPGNWAVYTVKADGTELTQLTDNNATDAWVSWSPDGKKIAFSSNREPYGPNYQTYIMNIDGTQQEVISEHDNRTMRPAWSPDGTLLAAGSNRDGQWDIYVDQVDGSKSYRLTDTSVTKLEPSWSPEGGWIIFTGDHGNDDLRLYIVRADGKKLQELDVGPGANSYGSWGK